MLHCELTRVGDLCGNVLRSCKCFGNWEFSVILIFTIEQSIVTIPEVLSVSSVMDIWCATE